jgi:hypothetical protein
MAQAVYFTSKASMDFRAASASAGERVLREKSSEFSRADTPARAVAYFKNLLLDISMVSLLPVERPVGRFEGFFIRSDIRGHGFGSVLRVPIFRFYRRPDLRNFTWIIEVPNTWPFHAAATQAGSSIPAASR